LSAGIFAGNGATRRIDIAPALNERSIFRRFRPPRLFFFRVQLLFLPAPALRRFGRLRRPARFRRHCHSGHHFPQFLQAIALVLSLVAKPLAREHQVAFDGNPVAKARHEPQPHVFGQGCARFYWPPQYGLRVQLVDILSARTGTSHVRKLELVVGDVNAWGNDDHKTT